jgi:hypothetical protein
MIDETECGRMCTAYWRANGRGGHGRDGWNAGRWTFSLALFFFFFFSFTPQYRLHADSVHDDERELTIDKLDIKTEADAPMHRRC